MRWIMAPTVALLFAGVAAASLDQAKAEPNLEKRSKLALDNAVSSLRTARDAYNTGDMKTVAAGVAEMQESVDVAYQSLMQTGKNPRRSPKWFKRAEIETRNLLRSVEDFQQEMGYNDRPLLDKPKARIQQVHDDLLTGLMEGKKR
jgi:hypothetical protein